MKTKHFIKSLLLLLLIGIGNNLFAEGKFVMFVVYNSADTAIWAKTDAENLSKEARKISNILDMELVLKVYKQEDLTSSSLRSKINNISCGSNDVFWFAYSGHGEGTTSKYPIMTGRGAKLSQDEVHRLVKAKGSRLSITTFDCCNYTMQRVENRGPGVSVGFKNPLAYAKLFKYAKGDMKIVGIEKAFFRKGFATGHSDYGGLFTFSFIEAIEYYCNSDETINDITWDKIIAKTKKKTNFLAKQIPIIRRGQIVGYRQQVPYAELNIQQNPLPVHNPAPCYTVKANETNESLAKFFTEIAGYTIKTSDLEWCNGGKVGDKKLKEGDQIKLPE